MFSHIFKFELGYWIKNPLPYVFTAVLFGISFLTMWGMSAEAETGDNIVMMNSYYKINNMANLFALLLLFLLPAIIGNSIFRDYKSRMFSFLYSYPFEKADYLGAKFLSAFLIVIIIVGFLVTGFALGSLMPGVKKEAMLPFDIANYLQLIFVFILPNMLLFSSIILAIVVKTRNIYISFIGVILMIMVQGFSSGVLGQNGLEVFAALIDPLGDAAVKYTVRFWTLEERNYNTLPMQGVILYNRLLWFGVSILLLIWTYMKFEFSQFASSGSKRKKQIDKKLVIENKVTDINIPTSDLDFSLSNQLKTAWHLSSVDFRSIAWSWPFLSILLAGLLLVLFQQHQMGTEQGIAMVRTTANMLRVPMFIFSGIVNLLTFLYAGVLMYKGKMSRMDGLIDTTAQPDWVLLLSRLWAILRIQLLLLTLVMLAGMTAQVLSGYYRFELWHYAFELFILQGVHFCIWACMAICMHSISKNMYLGYFFLILVPISIIFIPSIADYLEIELLKENIFHYNTVKGLFLGFDYSAFNGYGSQLVTYFAYKFYWLVGGIVLLLVGLLWWKRGLTFTLKERWQLARARCTGILRYGLLLGIIVFIGMGSTIYYQEHHVSKVSFSETFQEKISVLNEQRYGHMENMIQPQLSDITMTMDIYPKTKDFMATGNLTFINRTDQIIDTIVIAKSFKEITQCSISQSHIVLVNDDDLHYKIILLEDALQKGDSMNIQFSIKNHPNSFLHHNSRVVSDGTYMQSHIIPVLGIRNVFITNAKTRKKYGLGDRTIRELLPSDSTLLGYEYTNNNMGTISYECIMSTSSDQRAFTLGDILNQWNEDNRQYVHFKSAVPVTTSLTWISGSFEKTSAAPNHQYLELYRHHLHGANDEHLIHGVRSSIDYCAGLFGPLEHDTLRLIEFPNTRGTFATISGNLIPTSESYFMCDVDHADNDMFNMPFFVAAHEVAHYWWGHRVDPANVPGGRFITEGMADYLAIKAIEQEYGEDKGLEFRKMYHRIYLEQRATQANETPLIHSSLENEYLNYRKSALSLYSMSQHIGEKAFHDALSSFEKRYRYAPPPYATSLDFVAQIKEATPDSLKYLVYDMFETITLYDNEIKEVIISENDHGYDVNVLLTMSKYRSDNKGKRSYGSSPLKKEGRSSLPLNDYVQISLFDKDDSLISNHRLLVTQIDNNLSLKLSTPPSKVVVDADYLLIDVNREDDVWKAE